MTINNSWGRGGERKKCVPSFFVPKKKERDRTKEIFLPVGYPEGEECDSVFLNCKEKKGKP